MVPAGHRGCWTPLTDRGLRGATRAGVEELVRRFHGVWDPFDVTAIPGLLHPEVRFRGSLGQEVHGHQGMEHYVRVVEAFAADFHNVVRETISQGTRIFAELLYSGTHTGELLGRGPSGRRFAYHGAAVFDVAHCRIERVWVLGDLHGLLAQLDCA